MKTAYQKHAFTNALVLIAAANCILFLYFVEKASIRVPVLDLLNWLRFYGERSKDGDWLGYLWTPLNGHREVFTRMLLALDVKWFGAQGETFAASGFVLLLGMAVAICWRILKSDLSISWKLTAILIAVLLLTPVNTVIMIGMQQNGCLLQISSFGVFARVALNCVANGKVHFRTSGFNRRRAISRYFHSLQKPGRRAAGIAGGSAVGDLLKGFDLGPLRNAVAGAVGGVVGAKILELLIPALRGLDVVPVVGQAIVAFASGAALTAVAGALMRWYRRSVQGRHTFLRGWPLKR